MSSGCGCKEVQTNTRGLYKASLGSHMKSCTCFIREEAHKRTLHILR